jgi:hypothetical protein
MAKLEDLIHNSYGGAQLFDVCFKEDCFGRHDVLQSGMNEKLPVTVVDKATSELLEVPALFETVDFTNTTLGKYTLWRSLLQPLADIELLQSKQDSLKELENDETMRVSVNDYMLSLKDKEYEMLDFFFRGRYFGTQYGEYDQTKRYFERMVKNTKTIPEPQTPYLKTLINDIDSIDGTHTFELIKGPVYLTWKGLKPGSEVGLFTPKIKFTTWRVKPTFVATSMISTLLGTAAMVSAVEGSYLADIGFGAMILSMFSWFATAFYPSYFDQHTFIDPLKNLYKFDPDTRRGLEAAGKIDELLSMSEYGRRIGDYSTMPNLSDANPHHFKSGGMVNPVLWNPKEDDSRFCVPNDVELDGQRLTVLTGPNSGGKTTYAKSVAQTQILAQIGSYVPAREAEMAIADRIFYQAPMFNSLTDSEGRFGTELARTRDIFFRTTPRSLVILDDALAGATTHLESVQTSYDILDGFYHIGNNTLLITHNTDLAASLEEERRGKYLQAEFKSGSPTYRLIPGVSTDSHSKEVAINVGFSREHIADYLRREGYMRAE